MYRLLDLIIAILALVFVLPACIFIYICCNFSTRKPLFKQKRVGKDEKIFTLYKFRTMREDTPNVATHMADASRVTKTGRFLRTTKLDELPQLINVLNGSMSFVGPRPCLPNQEELIKLRRDNKVFDVRPGITGLAQISGIDMSDPALLVTKEVHMIKSYSLSAYINYIFKTFIGRGHGDRVRGSTE
jgi:lipopolysaccharide/colanic/teichoic acid biosynthesis glycosyltransferase